MKKLAFTLTELIVALGVIGILCAVLLPVIQNLLPNQNVIMAKRAYYVAQETVSDLINDDNCYPDKTLLSADARVGFDDGEGYINCYAYPAGSSSSSKFMSLFASRLDKSSDLSGGEFTTKDGINWKFTSVDFKTNDATSYATLVVDVNGEDKPNCGDVTNKTNCSSRKRSFDQFAMKVYADGAIEILDEWVKDAVHVNKDMTEDKEFSTSE